MPDFGIDVNVGNSIGIGGTGFGSQEAQTAIGGLMDMSTGIDAPSRDLFQGLPALPQDERSLVEKAAGWVSDKVSAKIDNMMNNPVATAINAAFGFVPAAGIMNTLSGAFGGPTVGSMATAIGRGIANGDITPGIAQDVSSSVGNQEVPETGPNMKSIRYFKYRDGRIESRVVDESIPAPRSDNEYIAGREEASYSRG